jgi:hypothetical protein
MAVKVREKEIGKVSVTILDPGSNSRVLAARFILVFYYVRRAEKVRRRSRQQWQISRICQLKK